MTRNSRQNSVAYGNIVLLIREDLEAVICCSSVSIVTRLWVGRSGFHSRQDQGISLFCTTVPRSAMGPIQPAIHWAPGALSGGETTSGLKLTTHLHLMATLIMRGAVPLLPHKSSCRGG
jgi:hypothetical protein